MSDAPRTDGGGATMDKDSRAAGNAKADSAAVLYEKVGERIARVTLNRPDKANAQNYQLLYELNAAFDRAVADDDVRV
ncbi:MAG: hypothetical protein PVH91_12485, partial [Pseudomonadales bacterium]